MWILFLNLKHYADLLKKKNDTTLIESASSPIFVNLFKKQFFDK
jgi:hypothetical protein